MPQTENYLSQTENLNTKVWLFGPLSLAAAAQAVTNGDPLQQYATIQPYAGIGEYATIHPSYAGIGELENSDHYFNNIY